jgi:Na+/melibiose symporter-like transporter
MTTKGKLAWGFVLLVTVLHLDFWWWDSTDIVLGFVPLALASQIGITLAAGLAWALVAHYAWPSDVEEWATAGQETGAGPDARGGRP